MTDWQTHADKENSLWCKTKPLCRPPSWNGLHPRVPHQRPTLAKYCFPRPSWRVDVRFLFLLTPLRRFGLWCLWKKNSCKSQRGWGRSGPQASRLFLLHILFNQGRPGGSVREARSDQSPARAVRLNYFTHREADSPLQQTELLQDGHSEGFL